MLVRRSILLLWSIEFIAWSADGQSAAYVEMYDTLLIMTDFFLDFSQALSTAKGRLAIAIRWSSICSKSSIVGMVSVSTLREINQLIQTTGREMLLRPSLIRRILVLSSEVSRRWLSLSSQMSSVVLGCFFLLV